MVEFHHANLTYSGFLRDENHNALIVHLMMQANLRSNDFTEWIFTFLATFQTISKRRYAETTGVPSKRAACLLILGQTFSPRITFEAVADAMFA